MSYEAVDHWKQQRADNKIWLPRGDRTITKQAAAFIEALCKGDADFIIEQPEDYCFARMLGRMTKEEAMLKWHTLKSHESNRLEEMEKVLYRAVNNITIDSKDHRAVQAAVMYGRIKNMPIKVLYPEAVNKSWPQFWRFIEDSEGLRNNIQKD